MTLSLSIKIDLPQTVTDVCVTSYKISSTKLKRGEFMKIFQVYCQS